MKNQFVKIFSWMTELGLTGSELIVYAFIVGYTGFKGYFDGTPVWLSKWTGTTPREVMDGLDSLVKKGLIYRAGVKGNCEMFKSCTLTGGHYTPPSKEPEHNINIYIEQPIDKKDNNSIEQSIDDSKNLNSIERSIEHHIDTKKEPSWKAQDRSNVKTDPKMLELLEKYDWDVTRVPLEELGRAAGVL